MGKLLVLMIVAFVDMIGTVMLLPLLPLYAEHFGANAFVVGVLVSAFSVAQLVSAPMWGRLSDQRGRRPAILIGLLISAGAYVIFAYARSIELLLLSRVIQGLGGGTIGVVQAYVADVSAPEDRAKSLGWLSSVTSFGAVIGPALGSVLARLWGQMAPGLASAVLCVAVSGFAWRYLREAHELRRPSMAHATMAKPRSSWEAIWHVIGASGEPAPRLIWIYTVAIGAFYGTAPIIPLLLSERLHFTEANIGYLFMYVGGMGVVVRALILGRMVDWLGEARLCRLGLVLLAAGLGTTTAVHSFPVLLVSITLMPIGTAFVFPCVTGLLSQIVQSNERGLFLGVQQTFGGISRVAFPIGAGLLMDRFGRGSPYWIAGLLVLATLMLTANMESYMRPRKAAPAAA